jgi:predicted transcriptional regulator
MLFDQVNKELELSQRHLEVLKVVVERGPIGILKLAEETGMPTHKVRYSLRVLEQEQLIKPSSHGAVAGDSVKDFLSDFEQNINELIDKAEAVKEIGTSF